MKTIVALIAALSLGGAAQAAEPLGPGALYDDLNQRLTQDCNAGRTNRLAETLAFGTGRSVLSRLGEGLRYCSEIDHRLILGSVLNRIEFEGPERDPSLEHAAVLLIGSRRYEDRLPVLTALLRSESRSVRIATLRVLSRFGTRGQACVTEQFLGSLPEPLREPVLRLAQEDARAAAESCAALLDQPDAELRLFGLEALAALGQDAQPYADRIGALRGERDREISARAVSVYEELAPLVRTGHGTAAGDSMLPPKFPSQSDVIRRPRPEPAAGPPFQAAHPGALPQERN